RARQKPNLQRPAKPFWAGASSDEAVGIRSRRENVDTLSWLAVVLLLGSITAQALLVAAEAYTLAVPINRSRLGGSARGGISQTDALRRYMEDRSFLLACLGWGRTAAVAAVTGLALFLVSRESSGEWWRYT